MGLQEGRKGSITPTRALALAVSLLVLATVVTALWIAGSPLSERSRRLDTQRLSDLQYISSGVDSYYVKTAALPTSLAVMQGKGPTDSYMLGNLTDPVSSVPYEYLPATGAAYSVCATFDRPSEDLDKTAPVRAPYPVDQTWSHPAGYYCFPVDAEARTGRSACSLTNPCAAGQSCIVLPGKQGAACVPAGKECAAAGCATNNCVVAESYPAQVSCTK